MAPGGNRNAAEEHNPMRDFDNSVAIVIGEAQWGWGKRCARISHVEARS
jgi:hypothetical protein